MLLFYVDDLSRIAEVAVSDHKEGEKVLLALLLLKGVFEEKNGTGK